MVTDDLDGELRSIDMLSTWASLQYWVPPFKGAVWLGATYSHLEVANSDELDAASPRFGAQVARLDGRHGWI